MIQVDTLLNEFVAFEKVLESQEIGNGNINDTYRVVLLLPNGNTAEYILQRLNHQVFAKPFQLMHNQVSVAKHLRQNKRYPLQIAEPIPTFKQNWLHVDASGNHWRLFSYIGNSFTPEGLVDPACVREAAHAYGTFALALSDFPVELLHETIEGFHDTDRRWNQFMEILKYDKLGRTNLAKPEIESILALKPLFDQISKLKKTLPVRVTHNDTKAGNILFDRITHKALAVIDWDTIMPGTVLSDFGDMVRTFVPNMPEDAPASEITLRKDVLNALLEGYCEATSGFLNSAEEEHLFLGGLWMTGEQAMRFLTDFLEGDVYFKTTQPMHNLQRTRNQLRLLDMLQTL